MIRLGNYSLSSVVLCALLAAPIAANASANSKIYIDGQWQEARNSEEISVWNLSSILGGAAPTDLKKIASRFIDENAQLLKAHTGISLEVKSTQMGEELKTIRLEKSWNGLPVLGGETLLQVADNKVVLANADATNLDHISATPSISEESAKSIAFASYRGNALSAQKPLLKVLVKDEQEGKVAHLVYEVVVRDRDGFSSDIHFIDAHRGNEVLVTTNVQTVANRRIMAGIGSDEDYNLFDDSKPPVEPENFWKTIYVDGGCAAKPAPIGTGFTLPSWVDISAKRNFGKAQASFAAAPSPCNSVDPRVMAAGLDAWNNSSQVYEYYSTAHRRDSIDGKGMMIKSVVNFGPQFANAAWVNDKNIMIYGAGDGEQLNDFASALDVAGHELTHGVTSRTAALVYADESGALNESYSDVFGKLVAFKFNKSQDWKLGKDLFKDGKGFVRDMENPEVDHVSKQLYKGQPCMRWNDFCGVHTNSGIPNKAAVIISKAIGLEKLGKLYYLTLTQLLRTGSNFKEARAQTLAACATLFGGASSKDCTAVASAFEQVGITQ